MEVLTFPTCPSDVITLSETDRSRLYRFIVLLDAERVGIGSGLWATLSVRLRLVGVWVRQMRRVERGFVMM